MEKCIACGRNTNETDGCDKNDFKYGYKVFEPIKNSGRECNICQCKNGNYHHQGCDNEECPNCGLNIVFCDCSLIEASKVNEILEKEENKRQQKKKRGNGKDNKITKLYHFRDEKANRRTFLKYMEKELRSEGLNTQELSERMMGIEKEYEASKNGNNSSNTLSTNVKEVEFNRIEELFENAPKNKNNNKRPKVKEIEWEIDLNQPYSVPLVEDYLLENESIL